MTMIQHQKRPTIQHQSREQAKIKRSDWFAIDDSEEGSKILRPFNSVTNLVSTGDQLFFKVRIDSQYQFWTSDGAVQRTQQVKDLYPDLEPNLPQDLFEIDGVLLHSPIDNNEDIEISNGIKLIPDD